MPSNNLDIKAIIFDMDGTLLDTLSDIADSVNFVLKKFNYPQHSYHQYKIFIGDGIENLILRALPSDFNQDRSQIFREIKNTYQENLNSKTRIYEGIMELLTFLLNKNIKIGICTNKPHKSALECSKKYFNEFNITTIGAGYKYPIKPNPEASIRILNNFNVMPSNSLFVGDSNIDIYTAKNAGMIAVGVLWGFRPKDELIKAGADYLFKNPKELLIFLKNNL